MTDAGQADDGYEFVVPAPVQRQINTLAGKRAGLRPVVEQLARDPCAADLGAYRLSGPLQPIVCGVHLKRGYRLAFTMQAPKGARRRVVILYAGKRQAGHRNRGDVWDLLHDLFAVANPPSGHSRPPCCEGDQPTIDDATLDEFLKRLRRVQRGR